MKNHYFFKIALILFLMTNYVGNASIIRVALEDVHHSLSRKYLKNTAQSSHTKQYLISPNEKAYPQFTTKLSFTERFNRTLKNLFQIAPQKYSKNPQQFVSPSLFEVKRILHPRRNDYLKTNKPKLNFATKRHFHTSSTLRQEKKNSNELSSRGTIHISIQDQLTDEMDQLRLLCFPPSSPQLTSRDEFDERSKHIAVYIDNIIAAYGRLTPGPRAVFETWSQGQAQIPTGEDVIDLGRCCVNPLYRGSLLYEAIILKGFQYAEKNNYKSVVGNYEPGRHVGIRCLKLGFKHIGKSVISEEPDGSKFLVQPIVFEIKPHNYHWERLIHHALYSSPDKFWKNLIHLDIQTLEREDFINNHAILQEIKEITAPSYEDPSSMLKRDLNHSNKLYIAREQDGKLVTFFMVGWEKVLFKGQNIPTIYLGLSATRQDQKNTGVARHLFKRLMVDAQAWEHAHQQRLLLWYTTATPSIFHAFNQMFEENQPHVDGTYTEEGKELILAIRNHRKWPAFTEGHPFVVKGIAEKTRYSASERERIKKIEESKNFTLFTELGIDETQGDRMVRTCRVPLKLPTTNL